MLAASFQNLFMTLKQCSSAFLLECNTLDCFDCSCIPQRIATCGQTWSTWVAKAFQSSRSGAFGKRKVWPRSSVI